jgi:hypothetical protein
MGRLSGSGAIFLSAGVPDPAQPHFTREDDLAAITGAVSALLYVTLGRRRLIWGGHPAITPMIWSVCETMKVDYGRWVTIYMSEAFTDDFPTESKHFQNVVVTDGMNGDRRASLGPMRRRMLQESNFDAAVFIGGMEGILDEYTLVRELAPEARIVPIASTLGATWDVAQRARAASELYEERDYVALLHGQLDIEPNEQRYVSPDDQPIEVTQRILKPSKDGRR